MPRIDKHLVLSTAHISHMVAKAFDPNEPDDPDWVQWVENYSTEFGWFVYAMSKDMPDAWDVLPPCLKAAFELAHEHGAKWILFDCDESAIDELEEFSW